MPELPQPWTLPILAKLWNTYGEKPFTNEEATKKAPNDNLNQALSLLKRTGWLIIKRASKDARQSIYLIKDPLKTFEEILNEQVQKK